MNKESIITSTVALAVLLLATRTASAQNAGATICPIVRDSQVKNPDGSPKMSGPNNWWSVTSRKVSYTIIQGNPAQDPCKPETWFTTITYYQQQTRSKSTKRSRAKGFEVSLQNLWNILAGFKWTDPISYDATDNFTETSQVTITDKIGPGQKAYKMTHEANSKYEEHRAAGGKEEHRNEEVSIKSETHRIINKCETYNVCTDIVTNESCPSSGPILEEPCTPETEPGID